ncbi:response regulator transcription factor [Bhargavaea ullalensis]
MDHSVEHAPRELLGSGQVGYVFDLLKANVVRSRRTMAFVLIGFEGEFEAGETEDQICARLVKSVRMTDAVFSAALPGECGLLMPQSGKEEAAAFLRRFSKELRSAGTTEIRAAVLEVQHPGLSFEQSLDLARGGLVEAAASGETVAFVDAGLGRRTETVKVSVLDPDPLFREALSMSIGSLRVPSVELDVRTFGDGLDLLESGWTASWHPHLVILNDVLPKQNGLDVLHALRQMPNEQKFTVLMMTRRNSEEDMIYAYESGTDEYLVKPFNLRLFEAQVKRLLARLWS